MTPSYRAAMRYLGLDARPDRPEVLGSRLDLVLFLVGVLAILTILAASAPVPS